MNVVKKLVLLILVFSPFCTKAKESHPDQQSIDSLLRAIDKMTSRNYVEALRFIDSTLAETKDKPLYLSHYLYVKMKKSSVLLKAKAHSRAFQNLLEVEPIVNKSSDPLIKAFYQAMMAFIYGDQRNWKTAISCYDQALKFYEGTREYRKIAITHNNLADSYLALADTVQAQREINSAMVLHTDFQFDDADAIYSTAGEIELSRKNYKKALFYLNSALPFNDLLTPDTLSFNPEKSLFIAKALIGLREFTQSKSYIDFCKNRISNDEGLKVRYYLTLVDYFKALHRFDSALVYNEKALILSQHRDARQSAEAIEIVKLNERYENENLLLRQQIATKLLEQKLYVVIVLLAALSVGFLSYAIVVKRRDYKLLQVQNDEIAAQSEELRAMTDELAAQGEALRLANEALEAKVSERTARLSAKNEQLTRYAFFNAHKLRSPIATLLGLKELFNAAASPAEKNEIIELVFITTESFDKVVRESQKILDDADGDDPTDQIPG